MLKIYTSKVAKIKSESVNFDEKFQIFVYGFESLGKVSYKYELSGAENKLPTLSNFSKKVNGVVLVGAITDNYGILKQSIIIADKGKLLGISDTVFSCDNSPYQVGGSFKVYQTSACKIGAIVGDDIKNFDAIRSMSLCDADIIIAITPIEEKPQYNFLIRTYAYLFGIPVIFLTKTGVIASDNKGEICAKSIEDKSSLIIPVKREYVLYKTKRRGVKD